MFGYTDVDNIFKIKTLYTAFTHQYDNDYFTMGESHNFYEIVIVTDGEIGVTAGSDVFVLKKGQAVIHEPMEFHRLWSEGNSNPDIIIFSFAASNTPKLNSKIFEINDLSAPAYILKQLQKAFVFSGGINVRGIVSENTPDYQLAVKSLELFLLSLFSQKFITKPTRKTISAKNYSTIVTILENNIDKNLSVPDIAALCNMSIPNLKKTFSAYSGIGIMNYFNRLKITAAETMLKNGMTVSETADALGFSNQNYFSTVFKRISGFSPLEYKNRI